jgi:putative membrane protein
VTEPRASACSACKDRRVIALCRTAAVLAALIHVLIFFMESLAFTRPEVYRRFMIRDAADAQTIRSWAFNQGFYNLFLAVGTLTGVLVWANGHDSAGRALVGFGCASMVAAALVLIATDRRMLRAAAVQGVLPLIALVTLR